jgi:hypothetical protein
VRDKPTTHQRDLAKLPRALAPLVERPQWCIWRWTLQKNGRWQKPPFMATAPERHASVTDPSTWCDHATAVAAVQAGHADGISYVLTEADPFAAIDLDHCRHPGTHSIDVWAQNYLDVTRHTYAEVTPSGEGCRIWGLTGDGTDPVHRKFTLEIDGKQIAAELFRRTPKALTVTGYRLDTIRELASLDKAFSWAIAWGERRKAAAAEAAAASQINGHTFDGGGPGHDIDRIERIVREGPLGGNRSDTFHVVVGHYVGCDWSVGQIYEHLQQFPDGIADRYMREGRLLGEIERSARKRAERALPVSGGWEAPEPKPVPPAPEPPPPDAAEDGEPAPDPADELEPASPAPEPPDPELEDDDLNDPEDDDDPELDDEPQPDPTLPKMHAHGDPDPRPLKSWLIKHLMSTVGHGLLSGQWGTGKTFIAFDLAAALATGQPFLGHPVKRQCGVLLIAAEGSSEVRLRLDAVIRAKCGGIERAPFRWYETTPLLLQKDAVQKLIAMARQADESLQAEFGLPLGLVMIDTVAACAGYTQAGGESDAATGVALMGVLKTVAQGCGCFVLGVDHFGKNVGSGTRGTGAKEDAADVVWACLGDKALNGSVTNTRLTVRKHRGGKQGMEYPFALREVKAPVLDEDGEPETTMVVDWQPAGAPGGTGPEPDPWAECRRQDQRTAVLRLKRVLMGAMAEHGVEREIPPDGPAVRMIDQEVVRGLYYAQTPADGTTDEKSHFRRQKFLRALDWAQEQQLIGISEIDGVTYLRLSRPLDV